MFLSLIRLKPPGLEHLLRCSSSVWLIRRNWYKEFMLDLFMSPWFFRPSINYKSACCSSNIRFTWVFNTGLHFSAKQHSPSFFQPHSGYMAPHIRFVSLVLHCPVDQRVVFSDSNSYYQFSFEECDSASCEFRSNEGEWPEAVRLLLQLAPYVQFRSGGGANSP